MARDGKCGWGWWVEETTLINPGSLLAFRMETEFAPPAGLTFPGTGPTPHQGQRASCPPGPFSQIPKPAAPAQAASQGLTLFLLSHSLCQSSSFWVPSG